MKPMEAFVIELDPQSTAYKTFFGFNGLEVNWVRKETKITTKNIDFIVSYFFKDINQ